MSKQTDDYGSYTLLVSRYDRDVKRVFGGKHASVQKIALPVLDGFLYVDKLKQKETDKGLLNPIASALLGTPVYGNALFIPPGYVR